jgi:hypothetical protein
MEPIESARKYKPYGKHNQKGKEKSRAESFRMRRGGSVITRFGLRLILTAGFVIQTIHCLSLFCVRKLFKRV